MHYNYYEGSFDMYPVMPINMMMQKQYSTYDNMKEVLKLIKEAVAGEKEDELFYEYLIGEAPTEEEKEIIRSIRDDERNHFKMFRQLYYELTGKRLPEPEDVEFTKPESYQEGLKNALFGELRAVEKYRKILAGLTNRKQINMLTEIITDELKHANKYNYLITENKI